MNATVEFVQGVYEDVDSLEVPRFISRLTEDCVFIFGNADAVSGHSAIASYFGAFSEMIADIAHVVDEAWTFDGAIISTVRVTYTRKDMSTLSCPAMVLWRMQDELIKEYRICVDNSALFA